MTEVTAKKKARWNKAVPDPEAQRELRRDALYRVASAAFRRNGYHGTSLVDIAEELGVSKPGLYYYIKNKQDLLYQCHLVAADQALAALCEDTELSGLERFKRSIANYIVAIIGDESASVVILEEKSLSPVQLERVIRQRDQFDLRLRAIIEAGHKDGSIVSCNPKLAVFTALGAANWVTKWYRPDGPWTVSEIADSVADLVCGGLAARH
jgi:AcrR family transcriptional regulator